VRRPTGIILGGAALLVVVVLHGLLSPSVHRLPGIDSGHHYAWEVFTREALHDGRLPLWNPYHFAGTPHLADPQTNVFYPPALLLRWLPIPASLGWMMALHLWIAAAGTLCAARVVGLKWEAAAAASVAVMLGGSVPGWIHNGHLLLLYSMAWVPWVFALAIISVRSDRIVPDGRLVAVVVLQFLTGYLQGALYLAAGLALYFVFSAAWPDRSVTRARRWVPLAQLALLGVLCTAAAAFQLFPTVRLVGAAGRSAGISYEDALDGTWRLRDLATLFFPFYGAEGEQPYRLLADRLAYVGWMLTAFVPFAFIDRERRRLTVFLALLLAVVCTLVLRDSWLFRLHYTLFPGLRIPTRALFLATLALALLGGLGLDVFASRAAARQWRQLAVPLAITLLLISVATVRTLGMRSAEFALGHGWPWLPLILAGGVVVVAVAGLSGSPRVALAVAVAAVVVDVTTLTAGAVATVPLDTASEIRRSIGAPGGGRAISLCENRIGAREFMLNGEPTLDGVPALYLRHYAEWAYLAKTGDIPPGDGLYRRVGSEGVRPARADLLDMANVTRVVTCAGASTGEAPVEHAEYAIERNERAWPRAVWACAADEVSRRQAIARMLQGRFDSNGTLHPRHYIKVRWAPDVDAARRIELENVHRLEDGVAVEGVTWRYVLGDPSTDAILAIMRDHSVEDTHGVDRGTGAIMASDEVERSISVIGDDGRGERQLLVGTAPCTSTADVAVAAADRVDGYVSVRVNAPAAGFLFFSEPYYPERHAYVDGSRVPTMKADVAFTAVAVPAGLHRVELRYIPSSFYVGSLISGATGAGYAGLALVRRRRRIR
jgi:hypothetical protein